MRSMTSNDVARTAYKHMTCARICPSCKNDKPDDIRDVVGLIPFKQYYKERKFAALSCPFCGARWSHLLPEKDTLSPQGM